MIAASVFGIFVIPMLYVVFQQLRERTARRTCRLRQSRRRTIDRRFLGGRAQP